MSFQVPNTRNLKRVSTIAEHQSRADGEDQHLVEREFSDCAICQAIWILLTIPSSDREPLINLGSLHKARRTRCARHLVLIESVVTNYKEEPWIKDVCEVLLESHVQGSLTVTIRHKQRHEFETHEEYLLIKNPGIPDHPGIARWGYSKWIDIDLIKGWFASCKSGHDGCETLFAPWQAGVRPTWLIDVHDKCLVSGKVDAEYVALSYRWGIARGLEFREGMMSQLQKIGALEQPTISSQMSPLVRHAIELTALLDQRYIWIDNLCINPSEKTCTEELGKMGAIYANAVLTIVAMDENDPDGLTGLEGLTSPRLCSDFSEWHTRFGNETLIRGRKRLHLMTGVFHRLPYNLRAWTFQEFVLSRRRLIIEEGILYWVCQTCTRQEEHYYASAVGVPHGPESMHTRLLGVLGGWSRLQVFQSIVNAYNNRRLTYEEDALAGINGLLTTISQSFEGGFLCGIPEACFEAGLCWHRRTHGLVRRKPSNRPLPRRLAPSHLPSWSWIGWHGCVKFYMEAAIAKPDPKTPFLYDTHPTVVWYSCEASSSEMPRKIRNDWLTGRGGCNRSSYRPPTGWTRHDVVEGSNILPGKNKSEQDKLSIHLSTFRKYVYRHARMESTDYPCHWPFPLQDVEQSQVPPAMPKQLPNICCVTSRAFLPASKFDKSEAAEWPCQVSDIALRSLSRQAIGRLVPDSKKRFDSFPTFNHGKTAAKVIEVVAICRRIRHWWPGKLPIEFDAPPTSTEIYAVLWVEWIEGLAYRLGYGEVDRDAWEALPLEEINLVMG